MVKRKRKFKLKGALRKKGSIRKTHRKAFK
jgi:hypothetical protein